MCSKGYLNKYKNIEKILLFGSRARGDNSLKSDIDLAIYSQGLTRDFVKEIETKTSTLLEFDFSYELTHRTLNEFMKYLGVTLENSFPRTIFKKAYINNLISDDLVWINLLEDRNSISHIYNENLTDEVAKRIMNDYVAAIGELVKNLEGLL
ncbi:HI0074 family nucleotidyltransferase substrate-binding subunit [Clostridium gasigenes]|uniref:HI0074 family nucleotidyltransferase substrate-binding subunit n=1 Tax=Clostridium gasigenes TaxID=94869 RepID=UPI001C0CA321|nr:HI0074 family nucleotidyltransferase substrate-binding subunit [Clostridium gasigenes]MBU3107708.1 HI0074 family nucleotidyltransferase substrate-binding subunit [Clostridium gasigenes]